VNGWTYPRRLLCRYIEVQGVGVQATGSHKHLDQTDCREISNRESRRDLFRSNEGSPQRRAIPEDGGICAKVVAIDGNGEWHAVHRNVVGNQSSDRG
jgi:hypothetical protein